ncbi:MAG: hypothetical protein ACTSPA_09875, partial [Promethearchaeota archaeon]
MNLKLDSKISKRWLSILLIFTICISIASINGMFSNLVKDDSDISNNNESNLNIPRSATFNTKLFITSINQSHTIRGSNFKLNGYTEKVNISLGAFENTSGIPVFPIIDGHLCDGSDSNLALYPNLTVFSSLMNSWEGQFSISIPVPDNYDYSSDLGVLANITEINDILVDPNTVQNTTQYHDITTATLLTIDTGTESNPVMPGDQFTLSMTLQDSTGTDLTSPSSNFSVLTNGVPNASYNISSSGGSGTVLITEEYGFTSVGVEFFGMISKTVGPETYYEYEGSTQTKTIVRVEFISGNVNITNSNDSTDDYIYTNGSFLISGNIWANNNSALKLSNRDIEILFNGHSILTTTTGANGIISENFTLEDISFYDYETDTDITITIQLLGYDNILYTNARSFVYTSSILIDDAPIPIGQRLQTWGLIALPILGIAALIAGIVIFQRKRMDAARKQDYRLRSVDKSAKFAIITMLYSQGRKREAIAYTYKIYTDLINEKYSLERSNAQTLREFAIICVMKYGLDPLRVYPYISMIEDVIYGAYEVDRKIFDKAITLFGRIFQEITGILLT